MESFYAKTSFVFGAAMFVMEKMIVKTILMNEIAVGLVVVCYDI